MVNRILCQSTSTQVWIIWFSLHFDLNHTIQIMNRKFLITLVLKIFSVSFWISKFVYWSIFQKILGPLYFGGLVFNAVGKLSLMQLENCLPWSIFSQLRLLHPSVSFAQSSAILDFNLMCCSSLGGFDTNCTVFIPFTFILSCSFVPNWSFVLFLVLVSFPCFNKIFSLLFQNNKNLRLEWKNVGGSSSQLVSKIRYYS